MADRMLATLIVFAAEDACDEEDELEEAAAIDEVVMLEVRPDEVAIGGGRYRPGSRRCVCLSAFVSVLSMMDGLIDVGIFSSLSTNAICCRPRSQRYQAIKQARDSARRALVA